MNPTTYTQAIANDICARLSEGEPLRHICKTEGYPAVRTVSDWRKAHADFDEAFKIARDFGADSIAEEALMIADTPMLGEIVRDSDKEGRTVTREDMLGHRKLQVETRLKLLAKWFPTRYGDKIDLNHGGSIATSMTVRFIDPAGPDDSRD